MIGSVADLDDGAVLHADVGIVGAGFAGIDLARYLGRHGVHVALLESGGLDFDPDVQALARVQSVGKPLRTPDPDSDFTPYLAPSFRGETRIRQFGGTSNIWTGKWKIFDSLSFEQRPWIPHSGWPITVDDLRPFYIAVAVEYGLGDFHDFARRAADHRLHRMAASAGLTQSFVYWQKEPIRLASRFLSELKQSTSIDVVLGANATAIVLDDDLTRARSIGFRSIDGRRFTLVASYFVLATGGLEAPRLLLASNRQIPAGIGNAHDLVGRFYMDHPKHKRGRLRPSLGLRLLADRLTTNVRPRFQPSLSLSYDLQRSASLLNHAIVLTPVYRYQLDYPTRHVEMVKTALQTATLRRFLPSVLALAGSPPALWKVLQTQVYRDHGGPVAYYASTMYLEQAPNPESRVYLGSEPDALGMPKLVVDWRLTPLDHECLQKLLHRLPDAFARAGLGHLDFGPEPLTHDDTSDAAHHIGTTRMAATAAEGVVDRDCTVFGTHNLFIAASSVFPTGDSTAPTYTVIAVARRLGAHILDLRSRAGRPALIGAADSQADAPGRIGTTLSDKPSPFEAEYRTPP